MDKFVVKQKRNLQSQATGSSKKKSLTQSTLQSCAGVVVIEEFEKAKVILESDTESIEKKIQVLNKLLVKNPSKEVLIRVGIGKTVRQLRKGLDECKDGEIFKLKKLSDKVYRKWRNELERKVELKCNPVDVKCDKETERLRNSAIKFLASSLTETGSESAEVDQELSEKLEAEIFRQSNKLVNNKYRKLSRKVIFALKNDLDRSELHQQKISVKDFVAKLNNKI